LLYSKKIVFSRGIEIEHPDALAFNALAFFIFVGNRDALFQDLVFFVVEVGEGFGSVVGIKDVKSRLIRRFWEAGIEQPHGPEKSLPQKHIRLRSPAQSASRAEAFALQDVGRFRFQVFENGDGGLFD